MTCLYNVLCTEPLSLPDILSTEGGGKMSGGRLVEEGSERETSRLPLIKAVTWTNQNQNSDHMIAGFCCSVAHSGPLLLPCYTQTADILE